MKINTRNTENLHQDLRKYLSVSAARARIRLGWNRDAAINAGVRLHGLPIARVEPWVIAAEDGCAETRAAVAAATVRDPEWQPRKIDEQL